jgi:hypothetical protein|tara:strand:- start:253 stop:390 length:138 start_codon:yes stop_codon:yes gene_type:complete
MKRLWLILFVILIIGCGKRDGIQAEYYDNGQKRIEVTYKDVKGWG